jgi:hypothetical protein
LRKVPSTSHGRHKHTKLFDMAWDWIDRLLGRRDDQGQGGSWDLSGDGDSGSSGIRKESSNERANRERMEERLASYMQKQEELEEKKARARGQDFDADKARESIEGRAAVRFDIDPEFFKVARKAASDESLLLEGSGKLVPEGGEDGQVLGINGGMPEWVEKGGFPDLADVSDGTVFYVSGEKVEMLAPPAKAAVLCFDSDTGEPSWVEAGEDGTILQVAASGIEFAHLLWIDGTSGGGG